MIILFVSWSCKHKNSSSNNTSNTQGDQPTTLVLKDAFPNISFEKPIAAYQSKNKQWFIVEQKGTIKTINSEQNQSGIFLDWIDKTQFSGEMGLLGMALHPEYENNGLFYISYINHDDFSIISRFESSDGVADITSEKIILSLKQPYSNHNGGQISFGPDGYLYIAFGDGGSGGDPLNNGQNIDNWHGTMLRIDINNGDPYSIPKDNPLLNNTDKKEIYAYGLRNPWRWSFDKVTNKLWLGDVGQNEWEEINIIEPGANYGWNILEGKHCFAENNCDNSNTVLPVFEYSHSLGRAITGGFVYRSSTISSLEGKYIFADYASGRIWALEKNEDEAYKSIELFNTDYFISSFAEDSSNNIYIIAYQVGKIFKYP